MTDRESRAGRGAQLEYSLPMTKDDLFGLISTYSGVITLDRAKRTGFSQRARPFLDRQPWEYTDLPMICSCLRSTRLPDPTSQNRPAS